MFSYNAWIRPESKTTCMFNSVRQMATPVGRQTTLLGRDRLVAARGAKSVSPTASCCSFIRQMFVVKIKSILLGLCAIDLSNRFSVSVPVGRLWKQWLVCYSIVQR